ncbi:MAG: PaaI family thioesterase [Geothrix sp.]|uniref:PaaI family thioesterase n=1 Tax=Geothrix sp. TaxID=1962974 RepID=UPI00185C48A7|nr:PaaI family thioesterase [Geothrix sp.]NWJ41579.1 PaaI family thioesterase [Geothrix sp.]WIL20438.1 MAG: PaaI family thioesterase [Geothrix sp.]
MAKPQIPETLAPDLLDRLRARFHPWPLISGWGLTIESVDPGRAVMVLTPTKTVINGARGTVNGGVLATVADMVSALALSTAFDGAMPFATSDLHVRYLEPAKGEVRAEGKVIRFSGRGAILECRLTCGDHLVTLATANFAIRQGIG